VNGTIKLVAPLLAALAIAACNAGGTSNMPASAGSQGASAFKHIPEWMAKHEARTQCPQVVGRPSCLALEVEKGGIVPLCSPSSSCGFTAQDLEAAYNLTSKLGNGSGTKVAVIEAGDLAAATTDLAAYRTEYGLGTGTLVKYNENGQESNYPPSCQDYGWCVETDLDIDMISAACPKCTIYLMEAKDGSSISDFETAEKEAVTLGATIVSNSWICYGSSDCGDTNFYSYFDTPHIAYLASSGDAAYDSIGAPSVGDSVIAVGGTQLAKSGSTYTESVWNDAGAGCANSTEVGTAIPKPAWQHDPGCTSRTDSDVSAQAGLSPGVAVYAGLYGGWIGVGGTSVASPFTAGVIALAGNASKWNANGGERFWKLKKKARKHDERAILTGNDGSCGGSYLCTAGTGQFHTYSGPGGWGTPNGVKAY
jgi:hypothetical protein